MGHLKEYYERITVLGENDWNFIAARFKRRQFRKGEAISLKGSTEQHLSFVEEGIVRCYIPGDEHELTFAFCFDKEFACAYDSFLTRQPSTYALQALADTVVWSIEYECLQEVYANTTTGNLLGRFAAESLFLAKSKRELALLMNTATERYLHLFTEQPQILQRIPLKYVASYLGITPQALSRIRRQIS
jgi:CRP-like cAMP-binding protein